MVNLQRAFEDFTINNLKKFFREVRNPQARSSAGLDLALWFLKPFNRTNLLGVRSTATLFGGPVPAGQGLPDLDPRPTNRSKGPGQR